MTNFEAWYYCHQIEYETDDMNKSEKEIAKFAYESAARNAMNLIEKGITDDSSIAALATRRNCISEIKESMLEEL